MIPWKDALKEWNEKTQYPFRWSVPRKGTPENDMIREMMKGKKYRLRTYEPQRVYEEVNDDILLNWLKLAENDVLQSKK